MAVMTKNFQKKVNFGNSVSKISDFCFEYIAIGC